MSERQRYGKEDEKAEKEQEKHEKEDLTWEEKWRRDPVGGAIWALILIWAGLVLLAENLGLFAGVGWFSAWGLILTGAGLIVLVEIAVRLLVPAYRRPVGGSLIWAAILLGLGLGNLVGASIAWPLILIAVGVGLLLRGLLRGS
ncbi:MAG: hypothetical protein U9R72_08285 [Chloroflexota bacterium]|nr:hypothetical protein [Chloroflexota bacterium]